MEREKGKDNFIMLMDHILKVSGEMTWQMVMESQYLPREKYMKDNLKMINNMVKENILQNYLLMKEIGKRMSHLVMEQKFITNYTFMKVVLKRD